MIEQAVIEEWLEQQGAELVEVDVEDDQKDKYAWWLSFKGGAFGTIIAQAAVEWNHLQMQVHLDVAGKHRELLSRLDDETRDRFAFDLRIRLLELRVGHAWEMDAQGDFETLTRIRLQLNIFDDPLTKATFFRRNYELQSAAQIAALMFQKLERFPDW